ncbi:hypothetical protein CVT91_00090 [Candidatus Atribacteria bacterium HGW-Atribacteria-1]|nr:MAG: hypothetical protein CVT91_00090 [Candidatus Atribacteria bacterium HGW-Atribacteria-1]
MGKQRYIDTKFWKDNYIVSLTLTEKHLFLYFLTNPLTNICGIYEIAIKEIAHDIGINRGKICEILKKFEVDGKIKYEDGWIAIRNFTKHQATNPKIKKGIEILLEKAPKALAQWAKGYPIDSLSKPIDSLSHLNPNLNSNTNSKVEAVSFNYNKGEFQGLTDEYLLKLEESFPGVSIEKELKKMTDWLIDHPDKKRQGKRTFITNWLSKSPKTLLKPEEDGLRWLPQGNYAKE